MGYLFMILIYTGEGDGKTTAAIGHAIRALGHGKKVAIVQFMKGRKEIGEFKAQKFIKNFKIYQFGRREFIDLKKPLKKDIELAKKGLEFSKKILGKVNMLILDEINIAVHSGLLSENEVLEFLDSVPKEALIVLTGANARESFIERADLVTEMKKIKHPFDKGIKSKKLVDW